MLIDHLRRQIAEREAQSLRRRRRVVASPCAPQASAAPEGEAPRPLLAFCSNDYLGLAGDPRLAAALADGAARWGTGSGASHLVSGHGAAHAALEALLAEWLAPCVPGGTALGLCTGYMANLALVTALGDGQATLFSDKLNHASLIDAARLARAEVQRYPHARIDRLADQLARCDTPLKLIVTDAVFSMDGDIAMLPELVALAGRHDAWLVADDAHGFGVLGECGRGALSHFGIATPRVIYMATLGKAAGVFGAFVAGHPTAVEYLSQRARSYVYTTATPPLLAHAVLESLRLIEAEQWRRDRLAQLIRVLKHGLAANPWRLLPSVTAIQPLVIGGNAEAIAVSERLAERGLLVPAIRPPTVPQGTARLRISLSAAHSEDDVGRLVEALNDIARR